MNPNQPPESAEHYENLVQRQRIERRKYLEKQKREEDKDPVPFAFSSTKDNLGLPMEHLDYVKKDCKHCYGRGHHTVLVGDGYTALGQKRKNRNYNLCQCTHNGYTKIRKAFDRRIEEDVTGGLPLTRERAICDALIASGFGPPQETVSAKKE